MVAFKPQVRKNFVINMKFPFLSQFKYSIFDILMSALVGKAPLSLKISFQSGMSTVVIILWIFYYPSIITLLFLDVRETNKTTVCYLSSTLIIH